MRASWPEKYAPSCIDELALSRDARSLLEAYVEEQSIPNLFLSGPPGIGKSTLARVLTEEIPCLTMVLDASRDRGVSTIRKEVLQFARASLGSGMRILVAEEADGLTYDAQLALRNVMDRAAEGTRFIFTANYASKVIEPLRSRCFSLDLSETPADERARILLRVLEAEGIRYDLEVLSTRAVRYTDIRQLMIEVEHCTRLHGVLTPLRPREDQALVEANVATGSRAAADDTMRKLLPGPGRKRKRLRLIYQQLRAGPATVDDLERRLHKAGAPVPASTLYAYLPELEELGLITSSSGSPRSWTVSE